MQSNIVNYVHVIDIYAPCVVRSSIWNRDARMMQYCGDNAPNFHKYVLSISDEAFLLVVLVHYSATWMAEIEDEYCKVSCLITDMHNCCNTILYYHALIGMVTIRFPPVSNKATLPARTLHHK